MARVMKKGARLAADTVVKEDLSARKRFFECLEANAPFNEESPEILHIFDVEELGNYLSQTGFKGFTYTIYGFFILFNAEKG